MKYTGTLTPTLLALSVKDGAGTGHTTTVLVALDWFNALSVIVSTTLLVTKAAPELL